MDARDIMAKDVVTVRPDMSVTDAADLLLRYRIHGAPVVDDAGQLVGMLSFVDMGARHGETVRDVMVPDPVSASEDAPVDEIAAVMLDQMVRRVPVLRNGRVVGIVSASDIIRVFLNLRDETWKVPKAHEARGAVAPPRTLSHPRVVPDTDPATRNRIS